MGKYPFKHIFKLLLFCTWLLPLVSGLGYAKQLVGAADTVLENESVNKNTPIMAFKIPKTQ